MNLWERLYQENDIGWDIGYASAPLSAYIDQLCDRSLRILIPGSGNSYEGEYLFKKGFEAVHLVDIAPSPFRNLKVRHPSFPTRQLFNQDFFEHSGEYDLILEQTFFCAIDPALRQKYAAQCHSLLQDGGKLVGLLFDEVPKGEGPPYGGNKDEYTPLFTPYFHLNTFDRCHNSIEPRKGRELFMILSKR